MKRVAVSQRIDHLPERHEQRDALDQRLVQWLEQGGALAFPVPNGWTDRSSLRAWLAALAPDGVVLSGGEDLSVAPARDETERALLDYAQARRLPLLGLCRGMQMMSVRAGATLVRIAGHVDCRHSLQAASGSKLSPEVNSFHAWGLLECPAGYEVLARAPDDSIEAIRHPGLRWEGWMWHPERETAFGAAELVRLRSLLRDD